MSDQPSLLGGSLGCIFEGWQGTISVRSTCTRKEYCREKIAAEERSGLVAQQFCKEQCLAFFLK